MDLFLAMVPNSLPLLSSSKICFASFSVLTTMTRSKTSPRPPDCALEIVDELNDRNRIGTMANTSRRLRKSEKVFLGVWLSTGTEMAVTNSESQYASCAPTNMEHVSAGFIWLQFQASTATGARRMIPAMSRMGAEAQWRYGQIRQLSLCRSVRHLSAQRFIYLENLIGGHGL